MDNTTAALFFMLSTHVDRYVAIFINVYCKLLCMCSLIGCSVYESVGLLKIVFKGLQMWCFSQDFLRNEVFTVLGKGGSWEVAIFSSYFIIPLHSAVSCSLHLND